jgi:hypothetical protein
MACMVGVYTPPFADARTSTGEYIRAALCSCAYILHRRNVHGGCTYALHSAAVHTRCTSATAMVGTHMHCTLQLCRGRGECTHALCSCAYALHQCDNHGGHTYALRSAAVQTHCTNAAAVAAEHDALQSAAVQMHYTDSNTDLIAHVSVLLTP